jgi:hypothetical protein
MAFCHCQRLTGLGVKSTKNNNNIDFRKIVTLILKLFHLRRDGDGVMDLFGSGYEKWPAHTSLV